MTLAFGHLAERMFNTPLAYDPRKAEAFVMGIGGRVTGGDVIVVNGGETVDHKAFANGRPAAGVLGDRLSRRYAKYDVLPFDMVGAVAIIPIEGSLVQKGSYVGQSSGVTSYEGLTAQIKAAATSPQVRGVVFEVDSFGGEVSGMFETAAALAALSKAKPTIAILTDFAYSAAYALASQSRSVVAPEFGGAGSIGTIMLHLDASQAFEDAGYKVTIIRSGANKAEGNPYEPLPDALQAEWQAQADQIRDKFAGIVASGRRGKISKTQALATEAKAFSAQDALKNGLIDAIADPVEAFNAFVAQINRS